MIQKTKVTSVQPVAETPPEPIPGKIKYSELQIKDYDQMLSLIRGYIKRYYAQKKEASPHTASNESEEPGENDPAEVPAEAREELRKALHLLLARPNQDNMLAKILPELRKEMDAIHIFTDSLDSLTDESIYGLQNKTIPAVEQATYLIVLENILSELKPEVNSTEDLLKIFKKISEAKIKIPDTVRKELKLRSMFRLVSPSERAEKILKTKGISGK
ncbi:MAG: hypothetical protein K1X29_05130 [Bdellovibrionales bacterium]|nr:hypothetical protein [Bdellovibrionales bacterium]